MSKDAKKEVLKKMKKYYGNNRLKLPAAISIEEAGANSYVMKLNAKKIEEDNMQDNGNAFEGWSLALYAMDENLKITLDVDGNFKSEAFEGEKRGHFNRFLYRALRFSEQYDWLALSDELNDRAKKFNENYILPKICTNNFGQGDAGSNSNTENIVEGKMAEGKLLSEILSRQNIEIDADRIHRQLAVGLFKGNVSDDTLIFTGGKSAIDLWTCNEKTFYPIELKADNKMVGIVTEIFFYSNYMFDLVCEGGAFKLNKDGKDRGYDEIINNYPFEKVKGIMLADEYHPLINDKILKILNNNNTNKKISYAMAEYDLNISVELSIATKKQN